MIFSRINPYMWDQSASAVNSPVAEFSLDKCSPSSGRRRRSISDGEPLADDVEIELTLEKKPPIYVNATQPDSFGLVYQEMNVSTEPKPIQISVFPLGNRLGTLSVNIDNVSIFCHCGVKQDHFCNDHINCRTLEVFVNLNESPTPDLSLWNMTVPKNQTDMGEGETEYSMFLTAEELSNGTLIIGVREGGK